MRPQDEKTQTHIIRVLISFCASSSGLKRFPAVITPEHAFLQKAGDRRAFAVSFSFCVALGFGAVYGGDFSEPRVLAWSE